ncbi:hypothetical protein GCM10025777_51330 [Membranihabitans marinus]|uniref:CAAX prenyl protease 2/Lysostaphin resistance protein A-like domain-containing protein n=2 Tax=Nesterenkonia rhizosphaerae TaxID=1348272 RepID=A0ABP9FRR5_9MICC
MLILMNAHQPPPVPNPYGPTPQSQPQQWPGSTQGNPPYGAGGHGAASQGHPGPGYGYPNQPPQGYGQPPQGYGPPPGWQPAPRKRQQDSDPGRFTWWDLGAVLFYVVGFIIGGIQLLALIPLSGMLNSADQTVQEQGLFLLNAISYGLLAAVAFSLSGFALWRSIKALAYLWWLKLLLIPVAWVVLIIFNAVLVTVVSMATGEELAQSENQQSIEAMLSAVPFLAAVVVIALLGPYVEEYFFRHLLVGKLSRHINVWICAAISVITFPLLHFIPALMGLVDDLSLITVIPYVTMGILFTVAYIVTGRNLFYAWLLHAFNNFMSLVNMYFLLPWVEERFGPLEPMIRAAVLA